MSRLRNVVQLNKIDHSASLPDSVSVLRINALEVCRHRDLSDDIVWTGITGEEGADEFVREKGEEKREMKKAVVAFSFPSGNEFGR